MTTEPNSSSDEKLAVGTDDAPAAPRRRRVASAPAAAQSRTSPATGTRTGAPDPSVAEAKERSSSPAASDLRSRRTIVALGVLAMLGLLGTIAFAVAWQHADSRSGASSSGGPATTEVRTAAATFSRALTNFDGATVDRDFDRIIALSTGGFSNQADQFFSTKTRKDLKEAQASSRGEIRSAYVQDITGDRASVFVVVDQTIANNKAPQPRADTLRMELKLERTSGAWKVSNVEVLTAPVDASGLAGASPTTTVGG